MPDFLFFRSEDSSCCGSGGFFFLTTPYLHKELEKPDDTIFWLFSASFATRGYRVV